MGVGKEAIATFEKYAKQQVQIYPDACDYGVVATDKVKDDMHYAVMELMALNKKKTATRNEYSTGLSWEFKGTILIESSEDYPGKYCGYQYTISYCETKKRNDKSFFTITSEYRRDLE